MTHDRLESDLATAQSELTETKEKLDSFTGGSLELLAKNKDLEKELAAANAKIAEMEHNGLIMANFIIGEFPGYEDAIDWGTNNDVVENYYFGVAAKSFKAQCQKEKT